MAQKFKGAGEGGDIVEHGAIPVSAVNFYGSWNLVRANELKQGVFEAAADRVAYLGERGPG